MRICHHRSRQRSCHHGWLSLGDCDAPVLCFDVSANERLNAGPALGVFDEWNVDVLDAPPLSIGLVATTVE